MRQTFNVDCPKCGQKFAIASSWCNKKIKCPKCKYEFYVQALDSDPFWKLILEKYQLGELKDFLETYYVNNKRLIIKIAGLAVCLLILLIGCCKACAMREAQKAAQAEARRIAAEKEAEERRIAAKKEAEARRIAAEKEAEEQEKMKQEQFIATLEKYIDTMKTKKKPQFVIQRSFFAYKKYFHDRKVKYITKSPKDIIESHFNMDLPRAKIMLIQIQKEIDAAVAKEFPLSLSQYRKQKEKEAEQRFRLVKQGEKITIISQRYKEYTGIFYGYNKYSKSIRVNSRNYALIDLSLNTMAQIDPDINSQQRDSFVKRECEAYSNAISIFSQKTKKDIMEREGYIVISGKFFSPEEYINLLDNFYTPRKKINTGINPPVKKLTIEEELEQEISQ